MDKEENTEQIVNKLLEENRRLKKENDLLSSYRDNFTQNQHRFNQLSEMSSEAILIHKDGVIIDANLRTTKMFGYNIEELKNLDSVKILVHPEDHSIVLENIKSGSQLPCEARIVHKNGNIINVEIEGRNTVYDKMEVRVIRARNISDKNILLNKINEKNQELAAAEEELRSNNEDLQSKNEELMAIEEELRQTADEVTLQRDKLEMTNAVLAKSRIHFKSIYENAAIGILKVDLKGFVLEANPAASKILGYSLNELKKLNIVNFSYESDIFKEKDMYQKLASGKIKKIDFEKRYVTKNGALKYSNTIATLVNHKYENPFALTLIQDITEKKEFENTLIESEQNLKKIISDTSEKKGQQYLEAMVLTLNEVSKAKYTFIGKLVDDTLIKTISLASDGEILDNFDYKLDGTPCREVLSDKICYYKDHVTELFPDDQLLIDMNIVGYIGKRLKNEENETIGILVSLYDKPIANESYVSSIFALFASSIELEIEKIRYQNALKDSLRYNKNTVYALNNAALVSRTNLKGVITQANKQFIETSGYSEKELLGQNHSIINSSYHEPSFWVDMWKTIVKGNVWRKEIRNRKKNGDYYWVDTVISPVLDSDGKVYEYMSVRYDISDRKNLELERENYLNDLSGLIRKKTSQLTESNSLLEQQKEELQHALEELKETQHKLVETEKFASLGMLTAGVAHEINNPLNFIKSGLVALQQLFNESSNDFENEEVLAKIIEGMNQGTSRVANIVTSLGTFSHSADNVMSSIEIETVLDNCIMVLNHKIKNHCKIILRYNGKLPNFKGNEGRMHQVFLNLLYNAVQAVPEGGEIIIATSLVKQNSMIKITIADNGVGISEMNMKKIFEPFFTTKKAGEGTGLGMSIVKGIINEHNGDIKVTSKLNKGTKVALLLPV